MLRPVPLHAFRNFHRAEFGVDFLEGYFFAVDDRGNLPGGFAIAAGDEKSRCSKTGMIEPHLKYLLKS